MEGALERRLALDLDIAGEPVSEDDVPRPVAGDHVRHRHVAAPRVPDFVPLSHHTILGSHPADRKNTRALFSQNHARLRQP